MEITQEQLNKIFELASMQNKIGSEAVSSGDISEALIEIERKLYSFSSGMENYAFEGRKVLIADDLELSIYQLMTLLKKIGISPHAARHKEEALSELQKVQFDCVILDLFIPGSSDGIELLKAAVKKRTETGCDCKIVVISGTDDSSLINTCYEIGADFYIKKDDGWHLKLLQFISTAFNSSRHSSFIKTSAGNSSVSYIFKRFNDTKVFDETVKDINFSILTGLKNIIFDLTEVSIFDVDNAYIFAEIYKLCSENGGRFILVNPSIKVKEALSFAYLEDVIKYASSLEEALKLIES